MSLWKSTYFCRDLLIISFQKNIKVLLVSGSLFFKKKKNSSHPLWQRQFWFSKDLGQPLHTNLSARKRHRKDFFCLQSPQWGRQRAQYGLFTSVWGSGEGPSRGSVFHDLGSGCGMLLFLLLLGWLAVCCCGTPPWGTAVPIAICCCCIWCCKNCNCRSAGETKEREEGEKKNKLAEGISLRCNKRHKAYVAC